ncbi:hypothetical protein RHECNPAF_280035 [Rhizobium etli CNPAF512]|nr:hypothetical protein RHECNPAF_280035 [Rhizobium etli CNPAF512]
MFPAAIVRDGITSVPCCPDNAFADDGLAVTARDIEDIGRLAKPGNPSAQRRDDPLPLVDRQSEVAGAGREIRMVQVIGFDADLDEGLHQLGKHVGIVIDALQQHRLADHCDAGVDQASTSRARFPCQLPRMIGVQRHVDRLAARLQGSDQRRIDLFGIDHGNAGVEAHDLDMRDCRQRLHDFAEPARGKHQRIAAGEDDLPDLLVVGYVIEGCLHCGGIERAEALRPDHFTPEAETAIDRADMHGFEQYAIGVAVDDAFNGAMGMVTDRIGALPGCGRQLSRIRHELPCDRIIRIGAIDQPRHHRRQRDRVTCGHLVEHCTIVGRGQPRLQKIIDGLDRFYGVHRPYSATGAQST